LDDYFFPFAAGFAAAFFGAAFFAAFGASFFAMDVPLLKGFVYQFLFFSKLCKQKRQG
jgi:hypothetical protein